jgi:hypothetical protein
VNGKQSETSDANQWNAKHRPKTDHKSETKICLERVETKLRAVQLALEILTGVCATLPDSDLEPGADDEEIEDEVFEDTAAADSTIDDTRAMAVEDATLEPNNSHIPTTPSFLPTLLEPLLALIQPTELSSPSHRRMHRRRPPSARST